MTLRFIFLYVAGLFAAALLQAQTRPNIIVIYTDDQGYGDVSALNPKAKFRTPNFDRLAKEGVVFTDGHCADTVCTPSRYALLTGRYAWRTALKSGVLHAEGPCLIAKDRPTLASLLKSHGYRTAMVGKWHLNMIFPGTIGARDWTQPIREGPLERGFDRFFGIPASMNYGLLGYIEGDRFIDPPTVWTRKKPQPPGGNFRFMPPYEKERQTPSDIEIAPSFRDDTCLGKFTEKAVDWINDFAAGSKAGQPFFLYWSLNSPHLPHSPAAEFVGKSPIGVYGDFMLETDFRVGQVLAALDRHGLAHNTLIFFSSDNGSETNYRERLATHGHSSNGELKGGKRDIYEGGHRVPFIMRWPAVIAPGRQSARVVSQTDLFATVAEIVGAKIPANAAEDSVSLLPVLRGETGSRSPRSAVMHHSGSGYFSIREGRWKLNLFRGSGGSLAPAIHVPQGGEPRFELYDMVEDWREQTNLSEKHPDVVRRLTALATDVVRNGRSTPGAPQTNEGPLTWPQLTWLSDAPALPKTKAKKKNKG